MDRTRRISEQILERHPEAFGPDFEKNKKALEDLAYVSSKQLRNRIAGYIAKSLMKDAEEDEEPKGEESAE
ncbi:MAG: 30S ribosomal protein S17e [Thaumarchaeota archaeon]|nr:30S ribosomal protein S17e [Nitrososphaerota archaeon]